MARRRTIYFTQRHPSSENGGEERSLFALLKGLHERGLSVGLIYQQKGDYQTALESRGIACHQADIQEFAPKSAVSFAASIQKVSKILRETAGGIHVNSYKDSTWGVSLARWLGLSTTLHLRLNAPLYLSRQYRWALRQMGGFAANSPFVRSDWEKYELNPIEVIENGIELPTTVPERLNEAPILRLGFVGRVVPEKGIQTLLEALTLIPFPFSLDIFGDDKQARQRGEGEFLSSLKTFVISHSSLKQQVHFHGHINDPWQILKSYDALVVPSSHDSFGRTLMEGFAHNKPVIASNCGGSVRLGNQHALFKELLFEEGDASSLAKSIQCLSNNRQRYCDNLKWYQFALEHFSIERTLDKIEAFLQQHHSL